MPDAVRVELRPQALGDEADDVVLEVLGHPRDEGDAHRRTEQQAHAAEEFAGRIFLEAGGILIDDVAEDQRIEQREHLVDGRQDKRQRDQRSVVPEVRIEDLHLSGHYSMPIALARTGWPFLPPPKFPAVGVVPPDAHRLSLERSRAIVVRFGRAYGNVIRDHQREPTRRERWIGGDGCVTMRGGRVWQWTKSEAGAAMRPVSRAKSWCGCSTRILRE